MRTAGNGRRLRLSTGMAAAPNSPRTLFFQLTAQLKRLTLPRWLVTEINTIQTLAFSALNPVLHSRRRNSVLGCNLAQRFSSTYRYNHFASLLLNPSFLLMLITSIKCFLPCYCKGGACTLL